MKLTYVQAMLLMGLAFVGAFLWRSHFIQTLKTRIELTAVSPPKERLDLVSQNETKNALPGHEGRCLEVLCPDVPCIHCSGNGECCYDKCAPTSGCQETLLWCTPGGQFCDYP